VFTSVLERVGQLLRKARIPYMIIGSQALLLYGEPRATKDIDVTLGIGVDEVRRFKKLLVGTGIKILVKAPEKFVQETYVLPTQDRRSGIRVDFIFSESEYERKAIERARSVKIGKTRLAFASVEDVIIHKIVAHRPRDLEDLRGILRRTPEMDLRYIRRWLKKMEVVLDRKLLQILKEAKTELRTRS